MKAIVFDLNGVLYREQGIDHELLGYISKLKQNYKLAILSSFDRKGFERLVPSESQGMFDVIYLSGVTHLYKPQQEAYLAVADQLGVKTEECLFIDDSRANVFGAEQAGMRGHLFVDVYKLYEALPDA